MAIIDFSEIHEAHKGSGEQDNFELFARDFLQFFGYRIIQGPDRGQDGGRDIIAEDIRTGISGESKVKWLVSCKHKAHSGRSVGVADESDIRDRVTANKCAGFLGFYSTLPSSALIKKLEGLKEGLKDNIDYQTFDSAKIEKYLLQSSEGLQLTKRYFPKSLSKWQKDNPKPEKFFWEYPELLCDYCGKNLLEPQRSGIFVEWFGENENTEEIVTVYCCCKGHCDVVLRNSYRSKNNNAIDGWEDIPDICIPTIYFKWLNSLLHELHGDTTFSEKALNKMINVMSAVFPYISRELTDEEKKAVKQLTEIPRFMGGLG